MDIYSPEFIKNPYPFYRQRRDEAPVFHAQEFMWTITGYQPMSELLGHPAAGRGNIGQTPEPHGDTSERDQLMDSNPALRILDNWMLFKNPPQHTGLRKQILDAFTHKMVAQLESLMRSTMCELLEDIQKNNALNAFDFVSRIAYPYPVTIISAMIGIPREDREQFRQRTHKLAYAVQCDFKKIPDHVRGQLNQAALELEDYFSGLIPQKANQGKDDLMSRLITAGEGGLDDYEILSNCVFLLFAGQETTTLSLSNGINALLQHPDQYQMLVEDASYIPNAVEECLRYDPPIQMVGRYALDDISLAETEINKGDHIYAFLGAAGRDPEVNADPDEFDIHRSGIKHLAFARGAHHCLGTSLARLELKIALEEITRQFPDLRLNGQGERKNTWLMRGFESLPVEY